MSGGGGHRGVGLPPPHGGVMHWSSAYGPPPSMGGGVGAHPPQHAGPPPPFHPGYYGHPPPPLENAVGASHPLGHHAHPGGYIQLPPEISLAAQPPQHSAPSGQVTITILLFFSFTPHRSQKKNYKHLWVAFVIVFCLHTLLWLA